jgi:hypothetical protein
MDLSILPDDIIKEIESYVDKSPPFSEELLNHEFTQYEWYEFYQDEDYTNNEYNIDSKYYNRPSYDLILHALVCGEEENYLRMEESMFGYAYVYPIYTDKESFERNNTLGLIMRKDADQQGIPQQTFNCGT